jgi:hypothetical protein
MSERRWFGPVTICVSSRCMCRVFSHRARSPVPRNHQPEQPNRLPERRAWAALAASPDPLRISSPSPTRAAALIRLLGPVACSLRRRGARGGRPGSTHGGRSPSPPVPGKRRHSPSGQAGLRCKDAPEAAKPAKHLRCVNLIERQRDQSESAAVSYARARQRPVPTCSSLPPLPPPSRRRARPGTPYRPEPDMISRGRKRTPGCE